LLFGGNILHTHILFDKIRGGNCTVLGYGVSNRPLVEWLMAHGAKSVTVRDKRDAAAMEREGDAARIAAAGASLICGAQYLEGLAGDVIFRSPGFRPDLPEIKAALEAGAVLTSEMELFLALTEATVVGISGSDGKTTTTTLTSLILETACKRTGKGKVYRGGNIGTPLLPFVEEMTADDYAVVELSSFQLQTMGEGAAVNRGALTNVSPNHLNWHTDMEEYVSAKAHLLSGEIAPLAVLNARNEYTRVIGQKMISPVVWFTGEPDLPAGYLPDVLNVERGDMAVYEGEGKLLLVTPSDSGTSVQPILDVSRIRLPGRHNVENYMTAIALTCTALSGKESPAEPRDVEAVADTFTGVPHRLELVREQTCPGGAIRYYNGSIDSSPSRSVAALNAMRELNARDGRRDPIVICGGQDKHVPFTPLAEALCRMAGRVVLTGEARGQILDALNACPDFDSEKLPVTVIPDYREAMEAACRMATDGDTVLLSPACTSFDAFKNFEERGEAFRRIVLSL